MSRAHRPKKLVGVRSGLYYFLESWKLVGGQLLQRPAWFYDSHIEGDGQGDIQSHYVGQAQRTLEIASEGRLFDIHRDVEIIDAGRWTTPVTLDL